MLRFVILCAALAGAVAPASGQSLLVSRSGGQGGYGYGFGSWDNLTAAIDNRFSRVDTVANFTDLNLMLQYDRLWLDQRWTDARLPQQEAQNIAAFIATGRRVLMVGENGLWTNWNNDILAIVGGSHEGQFSGTMNKVRDWPVITDGVQRANAAAVGVARGGTALFDANFATVWSGNGTDNVVTVLDVNFWDDTYWNQFDDARLATNLVEWLALPTPSAAAVLGLGALAASRRRR